MRVIFEPGDKPEQRELIMSLQKCGLKFVIVDETSKTVHRKLSDKECREAIRLLSCSFTVSTQWVAVYRILVDFYGYPSDMSAFCSKIEALMKGVKLTFPCNYQAIQKPLASNSILQKHYCKWLEYKAQKGDRVFPRQKMIADKLFELLGGVKYTMNSPKYTL